MNKLIIIGLYIAGSIIAYYMIRKMQREDCKELDWDYSWDDVYISLFLSIFSWITAVVYVICHITDKTKPPKWL